MRNQHSRPIIGLATRRPWSTCALACCVVALVAIAAPQRAAAAPTADQGNWIVLVDPENSISFALLHGPKGAERAVGHIGMAGWGPKWAWAGIGSKDKPKGEFVVSAPFTVNKAAGQIIDVQLHVEKKGPRSIVFRYDLNADKDVPLTILAAIIGFDKEISGNLSANSSGKETSLKLPLKMGSLPSVSHATYKLDGVG